MVSFYHPVAKIGWTTSRLMIRSKSISFCNDSIFKGERILFTRDRLSLKYKEVV